MVKSLSFANPSEHKAVALALLAWRSGLSKSQILAGYPLQNNLDEQLKADIARLNTHYPFQYLKGHTDFFNLKLYLTPKVLIPRPETEELIEWILSQVSTSKLKILDIGTGSGCIALALKKALPESEVWAIDISASALKLAKYNALQNDLEVIFEALDIFEKEIENLPPFDLIVSNPPYIPLSEKKLLPPNLAFEPSIALFTPADNPLLFYNGIIELYNIILKSKGRIYFEIHENYALPLAKKCKSKGYRVEMKKDIHGKDRMLKLM